MREFNKNEIEIFKRVIRDYKNIKKDIDLLISKKYSIKTLYDYIFCRSDCNITNYEDIDDYKYIDFNYNDMCISILDHDSRGVYLGDSIEVYNDETFDYIGLFNNVKEIEEIVNNYEKQ